MKKLLILPLLLAIASAAPITGPVGTATKKAVTAVKGKIIPCDRAERNGPRYRATCASTPLTAAQFKTAWNKSIKIGLPKAKAVAAWTLDTVTPDLIYRLDDVNGNSYMVSYEPRGKGGYVEVEYEGPNP